MSFQIFGLRKTVFPPFLIIEKVSKPIHVYIDHINLLCHLIGNHPETALCVSAVFVFHSYMKQTPLYKQIEQTNPGFLEQLLSPSRLSLFSDPEVIRSITRVDAMIERFRQETAVQHFTVFSTNNSHYVCSGSCCTACRVCTNSIASSFDVFSIRLDSFLNVIR